MASKSTNKPSAKKDNNLPNRPTLVDLSNAINLMEDANLLSLKNTTTQQTSPKSIIGMFSENFAQNQQFETQQAQPTEIQEPNSNSNSNTDDNYDWLTNITKKLSNTQISGGITLFEDNKIEIRSSPNILRYVIINPKQIRYIKAIGTKIFVAEKAIYGFTEINYEYHPSPEKNKEDILMLLRYIVFVKMGNSFDKFWTIKSKLFSENIDEQIVTIQYTYPIICLFSYGFTYEFYLCDASYEHEASLYIKIDNDIGFTNIGDNQPISARISIQYTVYTLYLTCTNTPKRDILKIMNNLFQTIRNAKNRHMAIELIGANKKSKIENLY